MQIIGIGFTGLIGTRFSEILGSAYQIEYINSKNGINILDKEDVLKAISSSSSNIVVHMAAKTNVDGCEKDKEKDKEILAIDDPQKREEEWLRWQTAYAINTYGTQNVVEACISTNKKIVYISTDFVFDGGKKHYTEEDEPNPINWYAKTKYEGEKIVRNSGLEHLILRPAYPYRAHYEKLDLVRVILDKLTKGEKIEMITDHIMVPTFIDDFVNAMDVLLQKNETGIFHAVGSQSVTPYELALKIAKTFGLNEKLISKTTRNDYFLGKAPRPFRLNLKNDKISKLGIEMLGIDQGLKELKFQREKISL